MSGNSKKIAVLGAGAVGSYLGAFLTREGHDVTLIDMWGIHVDTMKRKGLKVTGCQGNFNVAVNAVHLTDAINLRDKFDIILLAVKSYDTEWVAYFSKRLLANDGVIVSNQNCMNDSLVGQIVGYSHVVGCVMSSITVALWEPGEVNRGGRPGFESGHDVFRVGELNGKVTPRIEELANIFSCIDGSRTTTNLWGERWSKLTTNASTNPITAMTGLGAASVAEDSDARYIQIQISKESCQVALAQKYEVEPIKGIEASEWALAEDGAILEKLDEKFLPDNDRGEWKSSMSQDVDKGRRTEILFMNGYIAQQGLSTHVPTPFNTAVTKIVREIDEGDRFPDPANINEVLKMASRLA